MHVHLTLIIDRATSIEIAVALSGLKRGRLPLIEWIGRLHVIMAVAQDYRFPGGMEPVSVDQRMTGGLDDLDIFDADAREFVGDKLGRAPNIILVLRQCA